MNLRFLPSGTLEQLRLKHPEAYSFMLCATLRGEALSVQRDIGILEIYPHEAEKVAALRARLAELSHVNLSLALETPVVDPNEVGNVPAAVPSAAPVAAPTAVAPLKLGDLTNGQTVRYRIGKHTSGPGPSWGPWIDDAIYVSRRETPLPESMCSRSDAPNVGDILTIRPRAGECAEFSQGDFDPQFGTFNCEDWLLEIEGLTL